ncbi:hypothetical protein [Ruminococcus sp. RTP21484sp1]|uniref:AlkZ-related protein n=1 Tax=Ruminococcus sp. RTP21484sp1 TaxID=3151395 RepID=UPI00321B0C1A
MGNISGEWIIYGVEWDDPECIHTVDEAIAYINKVGFLPLFKNDIPGFSLEKRTVPEFWWSDDPEKDSWMWRQLLQENMTLFMVNFLPKRLDLFPENSSLYLQTIAGTDMILMLCSRMKKPRINIKRLWIFLWKKIRIQRFFPIC